MARDNFISDHLVDMRAQLRDSYENFHQNRDDKDDPGAANPAADAAPDKYLPTIRKNAETRDCDRERRDLEGRIIHDQAALDSERDILKNRLAELEKFSAVLESSRARLEDGDLNKLRLDYFSARGRWSAFDQRPVAAVGTGAASGEGRGTLWVAGAIIAGSLVIALVMIGLFS
ncbi:MAG: hypothetical protein MR051_06195 [Lentisphaeria bacterium]|nr:hypothetical protein [Lentisphaeria bacterium]